MDIISAMESDSGLPLRELRVDGGAARNNLLMQIQADLLGVNVVRPVNPETTVLGAIYLAGLGVGYWPDQSSLAQQWEADRQFTPGIGTQERAERSAKWRRALDRARHWEE